MFGTALHTVAAVMDLVDQKQWSWINIIIRNTQKNNDTWKKENYYLVNVKNFETLKESLCQTMIHLLKVYWEIIYNKQVPIWVKHLI